MHETLSDNALIAELARVQTMLDDGLNSVESSCKR